MKLYHLNLFYKIAVACLLVLSSGWSYAKTVDFSSPKREYLKENGEWTIYYEKSMLQGNPKLTKRSLQKLTNKLQDVKAALPSYSLDKLKQIKIFLMWGEASPQGGLKSGMRFVRKGESKSRKHYDTRWEYGIVIYSAENLMYLDSLWSKKALMHEFAHAWHILNWPEKHPQITKPWNNAKSQQLYKKVKDYKGRTKDKAYALTNQLEYFAELSAIYFVGGDYFPFNRSGLKDYDPNGFYMIEELWGL